MLASGVSEPLEPDGVDGSKWKGCEMARRKQSEVQISDLDDKELRRRLTNLNRGATAHLVMDPPSGPAYETELAAAETIVATDDEHAALPDRVAAREDLLASMGRLDPALRHCRGDMGKLPDSAIDDIAVNVYASRSWLTVPGTI
jgi:hypothetical protein